MSSIPTLGGMYGLPVNALSPKNDLAVREAASASVDKKIEKSASDFESILLGSWLEQAEKTFGSVPGAEDDEDKDSEGEQLQGIAMQSMGTAMTAAGGIGIAKMISTHLHKAEDKAEAKASSVQSK